MEKSQQLSPQYTFCYEQNNPDSLIMISQPSQLLTKMLKDANEYLYILLINDVNKQYSSWVEQQFQNFDVNYKIYESIQIIKDFIDKNSHDNISFTQFILLCPNTNKEKDQIFMLSRNKNILQILLFPVQLNMSEQKQEQKQMQMQMQITNDKFVYIQDKNKLYEFLDDSSSRQKQRFCKDLPNTISLRSQVHMSNKYVETMYAMLNQQMTNQQRLNLIKQLGKLITELKKVRHEVRRQKALADQFLQELQDGMSYQSAIKWYTEDSPVFKITNSSLRASTEPSQSFCIQPYFKILFQAIQTQFRKHQNRQQKHSKLFTCYRGGIISQKQIEQFINNVGGFVQCLGFLSTSLNKDTAQRFIKNTYFQISVDIQQIQYKNLYGYAQIFSNSNYYEELQILFNPLNSFKVLQVKIIQRDQKKYYYISLEYGSLSKILSKDQINLKRNEKFWRKLAELQIKTKQHIKFQGDIFRGNINNDNFKYWNKYNKLVKKSLQSCERQSGQKIYKLKQNQFKGNFEVATYYEKNGKIQEAQKCYLLLMKQLQLRNQEESLKYLQILGNLAAIYLKNGENRQCFKCYYTSIKIIQNKYGEQSIYYSRCLSNIASYYYQTRDFQTALNLLYRSLKIQENLGQQIGPEIVGTYNNIAIVYEMKGQFIKAADFLSRAANQCRFFSGQMQIQYARILINIGNFFCKKQQFQKSFVIYNQALHIIKQLVGQFHEDYAIIINNMANLFYQRGQTKKALMFLYPSLNITKNLFGYYHLQCSKVCLSIARAYLEQQNFNLAFRFFAGSLQILQSIYGSPNFHCAPIYKTIGDLLTMNQMYQYAKIFYFKLQRIAQAIEQQTEKKWQHIQIYVIMAQCCLQRNQIKKAQELIDKSLLIIQKYNQLNPALSQYYIQKGQIYLLRKQYSESQKYFENALKISNTLFGQINKYYFKVKFYLSDIYNKKGQTDKAIAHLQQIKQIFITNNDAKSLKFSKTIKELIKIYQNCGNFQKTIQLIKLLIRSNKEQKKKIEQNYLSKVINIYRYQKQQIKQRNYSQKIIDFYIAKQHGQHQIIQKLNQQKLDTKNKTKDYLKKYNKNSNKNNYMNLIN